MKTKKATIMPQSTNELEFVLCANKLDRREKRNQNDYNKRLHII